MKHLTFILLLFVILTGCDPCEDCGTVTFEPTVEMIFINADSLKVLDDSLAFFAFNDSSLTSNIEILDTLRTRLEEVQTGLDTGNMSLQEEKEEIINLINERQTDSLSFATLNQNADSLISIFNETRITINSGLLLVSEVTVPEVGSSLTYEDSATSWRFPLSFENDFSIYELMIANELYTIELDYETFTEVDEQRNVLVRARNIQVIDTVGFDSVDICQQNCVDGNASFTFYF